MIIYEAVLCENSKFVTTYFSFFALRREENKYSDILSMILTNTSNIC